MLIDIGARWCHWCRVMDGETYGNPEVVKLVNDNFIAVKVDRDERPDVDERYQVAHFLINRRGGGWPLTVFALPDGRAFESLTYIPADSKPDQKGMRDILNQVIEIYTKRNADAVKQADLVEKNVQTASTGIVKQGTVNEALVKKLASGILKEADSQNGGFGKGNEPKFPNGGALLFLLHYYSDYGDKAALDTVVKSLQAYFRGGLRDHVLGGYFRYATDGKFAHVHFEKMLYVQAELLSANALGYAASNKPMLKEAAEDILAFCKDTLENKDGGFFASQDADVTGGKAGPEEDGSYFTWTADEIESLAGKGQQSQIFINYHNVNSADSKDDAGRSTLRADKTLKEVAAGTSVDPQKALDEVRKALRDARLNQENVPFVDKSIYANWNGMMIRAYVDAFKYLGRTDARDFALQSADFIVSNMISETDGVAHGFVKGKPVLYGLLDDQVEVAAALLDCYEVSGNSSYLETAESLMNFVEGKFLKGDLYSDREAPAPDEGLLKIDRLHVYDNPTPSPNATAAIVWYHLFQATSKQEYLDKAKRIARAVAGQEDFGGVAAGTFGQAMALAVNGAPKALVVGDAQDAAVKQLRDAALPVFRMGKFVELMTTDEAKKTDNPPARDGKPIAYVCTGQNCAPPVRDASKIGQTLKTFAKPGTIGPAATPTAGASEPANTRMF